MKYLYKLLPFHTNKMLKKMQQHTHAFLFFVGGLFLMLVGPSIIPTSSAATVTNTVTSAITKDTTRYVYATQNKFTYTVTNIPTTVKRVAYVTKDIITKNIIGQSYETVTNNMTDIDVDLEGATLGSTIIQFESSNGKILKTITLFSFTNLKDIQKAATDEKIYLVTLLTNGNITDPYNFIYKGASSTKAACTSNPDNCGPGRCNLAPGGNYCVGSTTLRGGGKVGGIAISAPAGSTGTNEGSHAAAEARNSLDRGCVGIRCLGQTFMTSAEALKNTPTLTADATMLQITNQFKIIFAQLFDALARNLKGLFVALFDQTAYMNELETRDALLTTQIKVLTDALIQNNAKVGAALQPKLQALENKSLVDAATLQVINDGNKVKLLTDLGFVTEAKALEEELAAVTGPYKAARDAYVAATNKSLTQTAISTLVRDAYLKAANELKAATAPSTAGHASPTTSTSIKQNTNK